MIKVEDLGVKRWSRFEWHGLDMSRKEVLTTVREEGMAECRWKKERKT